MIIRVRGVAHGDVWKRVIAMVLISSLAISSGAIAQTEVERLARRANRVFVEGYAQGHEDGIEDASVWNVLHGFVFNVFAFGGIALSIYSIPVNRLLPTLEGKSEIYLEGYLEGYRTGRRGRSYTYALIGMGLRIVLFLVEDI